MIGFAARLGLVIGLLSGFSSLGLLVMAKISPAANAVLMISSIAGFVVFIVNPKGRE